MTILLFGVSNVGKSVTGELLASRLNYKFYDLDDEVKRHLNTSLEDFVHTGTLEERDRIRCKLIHSIVKKDENKVLAVTPLSYLDDIKPLFSDKNILTIELTDSAQNIFDRLVFSDEQDRIYRDDEYKNKYKAYYLREIYADQLWYGSVYANIKHKFYMNGKSPGAVVEALINEYHLNQ